MSTLASFNEIPSDITAICPVCQDAVVAVPVAQREVAGETQVRGLDCTRCGYAIDLSPAWKPLWWSGLVKEPINFRLTPSKRVTAHLIAQR